MEPLLFQYILGEDARLCHLRDESQQHPFSPNRAVIYSIKFDVLYVPIRIHADIQYVRTYRTENVQKIPTNLHKPANSKYAAKFAPNIWVDTRVLLPRRVRLYYLYVHT